MHQKHTKSSAKFQYHSKMQWLVLRLHYLVELDKMAYLSQHSTHVRTTKTKVQLFVFQEF